MYEESTARQTRTLSAIASEIQEALKQFLNTRMQMMKSEIHESASALRVSLPLVLVAAGLFASALLLFSAAAVALAASAFAGNPYAWFYGFLIVGVAWAALGAVAGFFAYNEFRSKGMFPKRTVAVLKADKDWLESEVRSNYGRAA
jgi:Putative Actinobacterial Holin-X, holin superfamily III